MLPAYSDGGIRDPHQGFLRRDAARHARTVGHGGSRKRSLRGRDPPLTASERSLRATKARGSSRPDGVGSPLNNPGHRSLPHNSQDAVWPLRNLSPNSATSFAGGSPAPTWGWIAESP